MSRPESEPPCRISPSRSPTKFPARSEKSDRARRLNNNNIKRLKVLWIGGGKRQRFNRIVHIAKLKCRLQPILDLKFLHNVCHMMLDRFYTEIESIGNIFVSHAPGDQSDDFSFTFCQLLRPV